jgi:hypothetical protein
MSFQAALGCRDKAKCTIYVQLAPQNPIIRWPFLPYTRSETEARLAPGERPEPSGSLGKGSHVQRQQTERREQRSDIQLPLTAYGFATTGKLFVELCSTRNVSRSGCCIRLQNQPQPDSALALRPLRWGLASKGASQFLFQIAWVRQEEKGWLVGLSSLGAADLYSVAFPSSA